MTVPQETVLAPAQVRIYKKSAFEKLPPLKTKSKEGAAAGGGLTNINTSVEMFRVGGGEGAAAGAGPTKRPARLGAARCIVVSVYCSLLFSTFFCYP